MLGVGLRSFSVSACRLNRAIIYSQNGNPSDVLQVRSYPLLPPPPPNTVNLKFLLSPVNPADINVVEGVYPSKPSLSDLGDGKDQAFVGGNEGLAEIIDVGEGVSGLAKKDRVVMTKPQAGTWCTSRNVGAQDVLKIPETLSLVAGATITVNPPTAYNMLHDFVDLQPGEWVLQNGANSAVGQNVVQIAAAKGLRTINFVRNRDDLDDLVRQLESLGATQVYTYDDLNDKGLRKRIKELTEGKDIRLALNCVGGKETTLMISLLGQNSHLVSYGAMSKQPLSLPTSLFIFKDLMAHGFWQTRWYSQKSLTEKVELMKKLADFKLKEPEHEILRVQSNETDEEAQKRVRDIFDKMAQGRYGKKVLLHLEGEGA